MSRSSGFFSSVSQEKIVLILAVALFAGFAVSLDGFRTAGNLIAIIRSISVLGILAIGMGLVVIGRGIDLSMVAVMVIATALQLELLHHGWSLLAASSVVFLVVVAIGLVNGFLVAYASVPALFATLATSAFVFGFVRSQILTQDVISIPQDALALLSLGQARLVGLPLDVLLFLGMLVIGWLFLRYTKPGRFLYLIGDNYQAARTMGIGVRPLTLLKYVVSALLAWVAGVATAVSLQSMNTRIVNSTLLYDVILVVVIGGIGLSGGKGGMRNILVGALLIGILLNGMTILDLPNIYQNLIKATILLAAIILDGRLNPRDEQTSQQGDI
ncbi:ABC transporter permease [Brucella pseudogrignonensis]|uniref:Ribose transport system permease protein n=1 Tax=Brucella pseudogrignonensis TaxID=419475 RepID=A0ABU1M8B0_9HYPH|nr:ABC transporter permease [Brucella pseudogrignonensis]MDR6432281.1 ribose transport system permease protein [Brucella pseudogrignonensis]